jgi:hypothetical protein
VRGIAFSAAGVVRPDAVSAGVAQRQKHRPKRAQVPAGLLNRDDVEAGDDLGDAANIEQIALG